MDRLPAAQAVADAGGSRRPALRLHLGSGGIRPMEMFHFLSGMVTFGFAVAGLFFLRFWKRTRDRLFLSFAIAFWLLGLTQALLAFTDIPVEERSWLYLLRLAAFSLILVSIWRKNRRA